MKTHARAFRLGARWLVGTMLLAGLAPPAAAAGPTETNAGAELVGAGDIAATGTAREHRIRRMVRAWSGQRVSLTSFGGDVLRGSFRGTSADSLLLDAGAGVVKRMAMRDLQLATIERRPSDLAFVAVIAAGVGALLAGAGMLGPGTDANGTAALAGSGALIGATIGWKTVYQDKTIGFD